MASSNQNEKLDFLSFLDTYKKTLKDVFYQKDNIEKFIQNRGFPAIVWRDIMAAKPLSVAVPTEYGGRGLHVKECLSVLEASSYESLPLSLTFGINFALFLEPVAKYGDPSIKQEIFDNFIQNRNMGGLMITEPDYGSDALSMQTSNQLIDDHYEVKGTKHWQGLTGIADYWLITSRKKNDNGDLARDIDFFVCDTHKTDQKIVVEELFNPIGLYPIPYGRNKLDLKIPTQNKLIPETTGLKLMMDLLHRSRYQFAGMGMGFLHRMMDEAIKQCTSRIVSGSPLMVLDQIKHQVSKIQSAFTVCSAMCARSSMVSGIANDLSGSMVEANVIKAYVTDLMQESAQTLTQVCGSYGYKIEHVGARGIVDSRPFQIFEGSNEMLYTQIAQAISKLMLRSKVPNLAEYLKTYTLSLLSADRFKDLLNFNIEGGLPQRKLVDLGRIISRVISADMVIDLASKGFNKALVEDSIQAIRQDISLLLGSFNGHSDIAPMEEYHKDSSWLACLA